MEVRGMLEGKYNQCVNMVISFVATLIDGARGFERDALMIVVHKKYSELVLKLINHLDG